MHCLVRMHVSLHIASTRCIVKEKGVVEVLQCTYRVTLSPAGMQSCIALTGLPGVRVTEASPDRGGHASRV
jgi:hypothetical protein